MEIAECLARASDGVRLKVGSVLVRDNNILSTGYNGLPAALSGPLEDGLGNTKPEVRHSEKNLLMNLTKTHESAVGATLFVTAAPCFLCSVDIVDAGIVSVVYRDEYRCTRGIEYLLSCGISVEKFDAGSM